MTRVVITGAECTGKTTLVRGLARLFDAPWVPEAARVFVERAGRAVRARDVPAIVELVTQLEDAAAPASSGLIFYDTDLLSTVVYARHYFGTCPPGIEALAESRKADLYILSAADIPWRPEADQRGTAEDRVAVQATIRAAVLHSGRPWLEVDGSREARVAAAADIVRRLVSPSC